MYNQDSDYKNNLIINKVFLIFKKLKNICDLLKETFEY